MKRALGQSPASAAAIALATGAVLGQPQGQDEGPVIVGQREPLKWFELERLNASFEFYGQARRDSIRNQGADDTTDTEQIYRETLTLSGRAFIGHENLVDLTGDVEIGYEDTFLDLETLDRHDHDTSFPTFYNVSALILGEGPAPLTLYARRDQTLLDREFSGSVDATNTEYGAWLRAFKDIAPTTFRYFHLDQDQSDQLGNIDYQSRQDTFGVLSEWAPTENQRLTLDYTYDSVDETQTFGGVPVGNVYQRHDATITHTLDFGPEERNNLRSTGRIYDQRGTTDYRAARLDETLRLEHSDRLETRYDGTVESRQVEDEELHFYRGQALIRHELFDSLITTASAGGSRLEQLDDNFTSVEWFGNLDLEYTKEVPYGRLNATVGGAVVRTIDSDLGSNLNIFDERRQFNDPFPIVINRQNIVPQSIAVTDVTGLRTYLENLDYTVRATRDRVELRRIVGGAISDGQVVLIDYEIGPQPGSTVDTFTGTISARYTIEEGALRGLAGYFTYRDTNQDLVESDDPDAIFLYDSRNLLLGAEYRIGAFTFTAEREDEESSTSPFESLLLDARYDQRLGYASWISVGVSHEEVDYTDDDNKVALNRIDAEFGYGVSAELDLRVRVLYRDQSDDLEGDTRGFEQALEVNWRKRQTEVFATLSNSFLDSENEDTISQTLTFGFRRSF